MVKLNWICYKKFYNVPGKQINVDNEYRCTELGLPSSRLVLKLTPYPAFSTVYKHIEGGIGHTVYRSRTGFLCQHYIGLIL